MVQWTVVKDRNLFETALAKSWTEKCWMPSESRLLGTKGHKILVTKHHNIEKIGINPQWHEEIGILLRHTAQFVKYQNQVSLSVGSLCLTECMIDSVTEMKAVNSSACSLWLATCGRPKSDPPGHLLPSSCSGRGCCHFGSAQNGRQYWKVNNVRRIICTHTRKEASSVINLTT